MYFFPEECRGSILSCCRCCVHILITNLYKLSWMYTAELFSNASRMFTVETRSIKWWQSKKSTNICLFWFTSPSVSSVVLHCEGEPRQRGYMCWSFTMARARLQPPHHVGHVAVPSIQRKPLSQRGADADAQQLHAGRLHHLRPGHGGQDHLLRQERRGEELNSRYWS